MTGSRTLPALLERNANAFGPKPFLVDDAHGPLGWSEAWEMARSMASAFAGLGVAKGDAVVLALENRREFVEAWFGLATLGALEVPVNPALVGGRLVHIFGHSQARLAVVEAEVAARLSAVRDQLPHLERLIVVGDKPDGMAGAIPWGHVPELRSGSRVEVDVSDGDTVAIMYTSGSTGSPKGAVLPHGQHHANGAQAVAAARIEPDDIIYVCLPLHHNMAQGYGIWPAVVAGATVQLAPRFERADFWRQVTRSGATVFPFVGGLLTLLLKQDEQEGEVANPLRVAYGVPVPAELHEQFEKRFGVEVIHGYGSTEATIPVWNVGADRVVGAAGKVIEGFELAIHDEDDEPLPVGEAGEICIRPRRPFTMFQGYYHEPERTVTAFRNLWFHSGDRGRLDADGNLWFLGRAGDVIRRLGEFVSAEEVELAAGSHPAVLLAAALGVPSELSEEEVMVAVVLKESGLLTAEELRGWLTDRLPAFAVPRFVEFVEELPTTPTGKVEKYKLRRRGVTADTDDGRRNKETR